MGDIRVYLYSDTILDNFHRSALRLCWLSGGPLTYNGDPIRWSQEFRSSSVLTWSYFSSSAVTVAASSFSFDPLPPFFRFLRLVATRLQWWLRIAPARALAFSLRPSGSNGARNRSGRGVKRRWATVAVATSAEIKTMWCHSGTTRRQAMLFDRLLLLSLLLL